MADENTTPDSTDPASGDPTPPTDATAALAGDVESAMAASMAAAEQIGSQPPDVVAAALNSPSTEPSSAATGQSHLIGGKPSPVPIDSAANFAQPPFSEAGNPKAFSGIELIDDVELDMKIELGRTTMYLDDVLRLGVGSVIELDKLAGDPVDIYVNNRLVARGEVLVLNDNFCVRINGIQSPVPELDGSR